MDLCVNCCVGALLCCAIHQEKTYVCITMMCVILSKEINNSAALSSAIYVSMYFKAQLRSMTSSYVVASRRAQART